MSTTEIPTTVDRPAARKGSNTQSQRNTHVVQFYADDEFLIDEVARMVGTALVFGDAAIVIATATHREQLEQQLRKSGIETAAAVSEGRYVVLDAVSTLAQISHGGKIDSGRFKRVVSDVIVRAAANARGDHPRIVIFGELVTLLVQAGNWQGAVYLEQLWNELAAKHQFSLLCGYPASEFASSEQSEAFLRICAEHSGVVVHGAAMQPLASGIHDTESALGTAEAGRTQQENYRLLTATVEDHAVFMLDADGCVSTWNKGAEAVTGLNQAEIVGQHFSRFYPPEDLRKGKPQRQLEAADREGSFEDESWRVRQDGARFWARTMIIPMREPAGPLHGYGLIIRDLTDRKRAEIALRHSEDHLRLLMESVQDYAIFMLDPEGRVTSWNTGAERIKGYTASEIIGQHFSRFYTPEDRYGGKPDVNLELAAQRGRIEDEGWRVRKDGSRFWANVTITAVHDHSGKLIGFAKVTRDVTERMRGARQLQESEERYRTVAETATDAIVSIDERSRIQFANPATSRIFGYDQAELMGQPLTILMPQVLREKHVRSLQRYMRTGVRHLNWSAAELVGRRKSGEEFPVEVAFGEVTSGEKHVFIGFIRDITERKLSEHKLRDSEKSLRELSLHLLRTQDEERRRLGRELHDSLGQYLAAVKMRLDTLSATVGSREPDIGKQLAECSRLTDDSIKEVRTISYLMYPPMLEEMGLKSAISWYVDGFTQRSGIRTTLEMPTDFERLPRDAELAMFRILQESLTNVHRHSGSSEARIRLFVNDGKANLEIQDRGKGLPKEVRQDGEGNITQFGVGLRGMNERLQHLGGRLEISSTENGTTVTATVPCGEASKVA